MQQFIDVNYIDHRPDREIRGSHALARFGL